MAQQINKLIGYCTLTLESGEVIPMKFGFAAITDFCEHFQIKSSEIYTKLFDFVDQETEVEQDGQMVKVTEKFPVVKQPGRFLPAVLWCGANYVNQFEGGPGYRLIDAANWIDEIGGPGSDQLNNVYVAFFKAIRNGGSPPKESNLPPEIKEQQKKKENQSEESH
ncbi:hypothetical protein [Dyadobacter sp. OTU695]|uniref:hypothetical protein n=1 Tax=Dyadobacter sp. OTU695 TaxID=3043860 RepID=UPI00313A7876